MRARLQLALALALACAAAGLVGARAQKEKPSVQNVRRAFAKALAAPRPPSALQANGYIGSKGNYVTPTCAALFQLSLDMADPASPASQANAYQITLPCAAGSNKDGSWGAPDYNCFSATLPAAQPFYGSLGMYFGFGSTTRVTIQGDPTTCVKAGLRPTLLGGAAAFNVSSVVPFLTFETVPPPTGKGQLVHARVKDIIIDGGHQRPGIAAVLMKSLTLTNVDIINVADYYEGAALSSYDSRVTWNIKGSRTPNKVTGAKTVALTPSQDLSFPGAGGALYHAALTEPRSDLSVSDTVFQGNVHTASAGAFYVYKVVHPSLKVTFKNVAFINNTSPLCSVGLTWRRDTRPVHNPKPGAKLTLSFSGSSSFSGNRGLNPTGGLSLVNLCGVYSTIALPPIGPTIWDPKQVTVLKPNPPPGLTAPPVIPPLALPANVSLEYAFIDPTLTP